MNFRGQWVLVTGASSGLGREMARLLAREHGANVVAVARRTDRLEELRKELEPTGVGFHAIGADLSKVADVDRVLSECTDGRSLYGAILNAGVTHFGRHHELSWKDFEAMLNTNVTGVVRMATELVPRLGEHPSGAGMMLVSSVAGMMPVPFQTAYSATKAFVVHFGCGLAHELEGKSPSITTYAPGGIVTEMTAGENFGTLRQWLMPVERAAREGVDAFRRRRYLHVPGAVNRLGPLLYGVLPRRFVVGRMAATYRKALEAVGK